MLRAPTNFAFAVFLALGSCPAYATPLHDVAEAGNVAVAAAIVMDDPSSIGVRDLYGRMPLTMAAQGGHLEVVRLLVEKGAPIDVRGNYLGAPPSTVAYYSSPAVARMLRVKAPVEPVGATALYVAALEGQLEVVKLLLASGAAIDVRADDGSTPLAIAAQHGHLAVARLLVDKGAAVDAADDNGVTPLARAAQIRDGRPDQQLEMMKFLLARGANPKTPGFERAARDTTALELAESQERGYREIAKLLRDASAK
jgi:ankyrin repeat protein